MTLSYLSLMAFDIVTDNKVAGGKAKGIIQPHTARDLCVASVQSTHSDWWYSEITGRIF